MPVITRLGAKARSPPRRFVTAQGSEDLVWEPVGEKRGVGEVRVEVAAVEGGIDHGNILPVGSGWQCRRAVDPFRELKLRQGCFEFIMPQFVQEISKRDAWLMCRYVAPNNGPAGILLACRLERTCRPAPLSPGGSKR